jgi:hypothetical protein
LVGSLDQVELPVEHAFHAGMYARTLRLPQDIVVTGSLMKVPTLLVFHGHAMVLAGDEWVEICGYGVLTGDAGRKQVVVTRSSVEVTMIFPTQAKTVDEAEREFTDEFEKLMSRKGGRDEDVVAGS